MLKLYAVVNDLASADLPVLVYGETGTGKELIATALHERSPRARLPMVAVNCAALHNSLAEDALFGHERGSFSGAVADRAGLIETASGSTLFLDEVGELDLQHQAKLLRVLESKRVLRIGDVRERVVDVRIVAATNRDLEAAVYAGSFRRDLYFRLAAAMIRVPPLRDRPGELPLLAAAFLDEARRRMNRSPLPISEGALAVLQMHAWPGNIRELRNLMEYLAATLKTDDVLAVHVRDRLARPLPRMGELAAGDPTAPAPPAFFAPRFAGVE